LALIHVQTACAGRAGSEQGGRSLRTTGPENQCAFAELTRGWGGCHRNWLVDWVRARIRRSRIHFLSTAPSLKTTPLFLVSTPGPFRPVITPRGACQEAGTFRKLSIRSANTRRRDEPSPEIAQDCRTKRVLQRMCQIDDEYCFHTGWCGSRHVMLHIWQVATAGPLERKAPARLGPEYRHTV
jgi:hypothetical protein